MGADGFVFKVTTDMLGVRVGWSMSKKAATQKHDHRAIFNSSTNIDLNAIVDHGDNLKNAVQKLAEAHTSGLKPIEEILKGPNHFGAYHSKPKLGTANSWDQTE